MSNDILTEKQKQVIEFFVTACGAFLAMWTQFWCSLGKSGCLVVGKKNQENVKTALLCRWVTYNSPTDMHEAIGSNGYVESKRKVEIKKTLAIA